MWWIRAVWLACQYNLDLSMSATIKGRAIMMSTMSGISEFQFNLISLVQ